MQVARESKSGRWLSQTQLRRSGNDKQYCDTFGDGTYFAPLVRLRTKRDQFTRSFMMRLVLTGMNATETAVKQVNAPSILHLANSRSLYLRRVLG